MVKLKILLNLIVAVLLIAVTASYDGERLGVIETLEKQSYDWRLKRSSAEVQKNEEIVIVDIDGDSLREFGNWPWSRDLFARLLDNLFDNYDVDLVGFALPFPTPDDEGLRLLDKIGDRLRGERSRLTPLYSELNYDKLFAESLRQRSVYLGYHFETLGRVEGRLPPGMSFVDKAKGTEINIPVMAAVSRKWIFMRGYTGNLPPFMQNAKNRAGFVNPTADNDGIVRTYPFFIKHAGDYYSSLPLSMLYGLQGVDADEPLVLQLGFSALGGGAQLHGYNLGIYSANVNSDGQGFLNFLGPGGRNVDFAATRNATFRYLSFAEVLKGTVPKSQLQRKFVLIGSSAAELRDLHPTPVNPAMPGVELVATQLANAVAGEVLYRPADADFTELLVMLALALVLAVLLVLIGPVTGLVVVLVVAGAYIYFVISLWSSDYQVWAMVPIVILLSGMYVFNAVSGFFAEWSAGRQMQSTFGQYLPPEFAKKVSQSGSDINLEGELRELTVLFSDVRDFTSIAENMSPKELTLLMNTMLTGLTEAIHKHSGTVDKFIGDAVMAFWNAPLEDPRHAVNAVLAAMDMQKAMNDLSDKRERQGLPRIQLGVGLSTGPTNVGNMGSALRMTYTAIGDTVNLASRTEGMTKYYKTPILITESTHAQCSAEQIAFRLVDCVRVKGREQPVKVYEPMGMAELINPEVLRQMEMYEKARKLYENGAFDEAQQAFTAYHEEASDDGLALVYLERLAVLTQSPPAEWDGVFSHTEK